MPTTVSRIRALVLALAVTAAAGDAAAQDYEWAASWNAGGTYFTALNTDSGAEDLTFDPGWIMGLQFERWLGGGRIGLRANGAITERPLELDGDSRGIGIWMLDADVLLRLMPARPERTVQAYLLAGVGAVRYKLGRGDFLNIDDSNATYPGDDDARLAAVGGFGIDFLTGWRWDGDPVGIRVEVADHLVFESPFAPIAGDDFGPIHNVRLVIGAFTGFGLLR